MSPRAALTLARADLVVAESSRGASEALRVAGRLASRLGGPGMAGLSTPPVLECDEASTAAVTSKLLAAFRSGSVRRAALISDAGTPAVSDPGCRLVAACHGAGVRVSPVPGPSAVVAALSASGEGSFDGFCFWGWVPRKSSRRGRFLVELSLERRPVVVLESAARLLGVLEEAAGVPALASRPVVVCRELSKAHETVARHGGAAEAAAWARGHTLRGEVTVVFGAAPAPALREAEQGETGAWGRAASALRAKGLDPNEVAACLHDAGCGVACNESRKGAR